METNHSKITVVGQSSRAASWSVVRAGCSGLAFDAFQDLDFPPQVEVKPLDQFPSSTSEKEHLFLPVGGWENDFPLAQKIESLGKVLNTDSENTKKARDPFLIQQLFQQAGLPFLEVTQTSTKKEGNWIRKPFAGTGGIGIQLVSGNTQPENKKQYDQQFVTGQSYSALFLTSRNQAPELLGITRQLIGAPELLQTPFAYVGSVGPVLNRDNSEEKNIRALLQRMVDALSTKINFYGLFCLDFVLSDGIPYVTEINPRYCASVEILELAFQTSFLQLLLHKTEEEKTFPKALPQNSSQGYIAKKYLFASKQFSLPDHWDWNSIPGFRPSTPWGIPGFSDLPSPGTTFHPGEPICTVWAADESLEKALLLLESKEKLLRTLLPQ